MAYVLVGCRVLLCVVFAASAFSKVRGRAAWGGFGQSVRDLARVPDRMVWPVAAGVVGGEVSAVVTLAVPAVVPVGLALVGVLLTAFTASILLTLRRGLPAACRCFGSAAQPVGRRHVVRNGLLFAVVVLGGVSLVSAPGPTHLAGLLVAGAAGLVGAVVLMSIDEIADVFVGPEVVGQLEKRRM